MKKTYPMKAINIFCKIITRKTLAIKINELTAQKANSPPWPKSPVNQKYIACNAWGKYENGLSFRSLTSKSDLSEISSSSFVLGFTATPLNEEPIVSIFFGSLSIINLFVNKIK